MPYHELLISAPATTIYEAIATHQGLSGWWTENEVLQNGNIRFHFGSDYFKEMKVLKQEKDFIEWQCIAATQEWVETKISFELQSGSEQEILKLHPEVSGQMRQNTNPTLLIFRHSNWRAQTPMLAECNYTWAIFLRSLKSYCETGFGKPFPNQHQ